MKNSAVTFVRVLRNDGDLFAWAYNLLDDSFPYEERRSKQDQLRVLDHPDYRLCVAMCDGDKVGVTGYFETSEFVYFENFCTLPRLRNCGFGSKILQALIATYPDKLFVLESELPTDELTTRRIGFYKRNGMQTNVYDHIQPHYHNGDKDLHLVVMSYGRQLSKDEYARFKHYLDEQVDVK